MNRQGFGRTAAVLLGALLGGTALAGGTATVEVRGDGEVEQMVYEFRGEDVRMGLPGGAEGYMVVTGGVPYAVVTGEQLMVIDLRQSLQMMQGMLTLPESPAQVDEFHRLEATGRKETVAGIPGEVYRMTYTEDGEPRSEDIVLSDDPRARAFGRAMFAMSSSMVEAGGGDAVAAQAAFEQAMDGKGMLRMGQAFRLARYSDQTPAAERFTLPAAPTELPDMGGMFGQSRGGTAASGGINFGGLLGGKAERQQQRVEQRTDQEIDEATDSAVDKALDKAFDKLFGN